MRFLVITYRGVDINRFHLCDVHLEYTIYEPTTKSVWRSKLSFARQTSKIPRYPSIIWSQVAAFNFEGIRIVKTKASLFWRWVSWVTVACVVRFCGVAARCGEYWQQVFWILSKITATTRFRHVIFKKCYIIGSLQLRKCFKSEKLEWKRILASPSSHDLSLLWQHWARCLRQNDNFLSFHFNNSFFGKFRENSEKLLVYDLFMKEIFK